jgi:hypothetical protein
MLEKFKADLLRNLSIQLDTLQMRKKKEKTKRALEMFFPTCRTKNPWKQYMLDNNEVCGIYS